MQHERGVTDGEQRRAHDGKVLGPAPRHDGVDRRLLRGDRAVAHRLVQQDLIGRPRPGREHGVHERFRRRHDGETVGPASGVARLDGRPGIRHVEAGSGRHGRHTAAATPEGQARPSTYSANSASSARAGSTAAPAWTGELWITSERGAVSQWKRSDDGARPTGPAASSPAATAQYGEVAREQVLVDVGHARAPARRVAQDAHAEVSRRARVDHHADRHEGAEIDVGHRAEHREIVRDPVLRRHRRAESRRGGSRRRSSRAPIASATKSRGPAAGS